MDHILLILCHLGIWGRKTTQIVKIYSNNKMKVNNSLGCFQQIVANCVKYIKKGTFIQGRNKANKQYSNSFSCQCEKMSHSQFPQIFYRGFLNVSREANRCLISDLQGTLECLFSNPWRKSTQRLIQRNLKEPLQYSVMRCTGNIHLLYQLKLIGIIHIYTACFFLLWSPANCLMDFYYLYLKD